MDSVDCGDGYLAGVFDGEGFIGVHGHDGKSASGYGYSLRMSISMNNRSVVAAFQERFGGSLATRKKSYSYKLEAVYGKQQGVRWEWLATGSKLPFLHTVVPFLIEKRAQVELAIQYVNEFGENGRGMGGHIKNRLKRTPEQRARQRWYYEEFKRLKQANGVEVVV